MYGVDKENHGVTLSTSYASIETPSNNKKANYEPVQRHRSPLTTKNNIQYSKYGIPRVVFKNVTGLSSTKFGPNVMKILKFWLVGSVHRYSCPAHFQATWPQTPSPLRKY